MNAANDEGRFEDTLKQWMMQGRPAAAPGTLRARVMRLPDDHPRQTSRSHNAWLVEAARAAAVFVFIATAGVLLIVGLSTVPPDTGGPRPTAPPTTRFDPSIDGVGILGSVGDTRRSLPWILAIALGTGWLVLSLRYGRVWRAVGTAAAAAMLGAAFVVTTQPGVAMFNAYGAPLGIEIERAPSVTDGQDAFHVTAEPNENFIVTFNVTNAGSLPVRVLGVVGGGEHSQPRWTAVGIKTDPEGGFGFLEEARPFEPIDLAPEGIINFYLVGRASICAVGTTGKSSGSGSVMGPVKVAFTVLGMPDSMYLELPFVVAEEQREDCFLTDSEF